MRCLPWLVTLTYARPDEWVRRHISDCIDHLRKWAQRRGFDIRYVWVAEIQPKRLERSGDSVVHYHIVLWLPSGTSMPKPDKQGWWRHGCTQVQRARRPIGYLMKYATKGDGGVFPRSLRMCGYGGLTTAGRAVRYWLCLPGWVMQRARSFQRITRLPGGLWLLEETGELMRSAWEFIRFDKVAAAVGFRKRPDLVPA